MADYPHLSNWQGWLAKQKYAHLDPFDRPIPAPVAGIFDNTGGDLRTVCFNPAWSPILTGALSRLTVPELYLSDGEESVQDVLKLMNLVAGIGDNPCLPQSVDAMSCAYYPSWYAGIEYTPNNPFSSGDLPAGYDNPAFIRFSRFDTWFPDWLDDWFFGAIENVTGYLENDIFVFPLSLADQIDPYSDLDYPTIKLTVQGTGILRLKFLLAPLGGRALISFDPVDILDIFSAIFTTDDRIIELNRDILALVPETDVDAIEEIVLDTDTTHEIYITFLPTINDEFPIVQYGGGFRGYEVCGNLTVISPVTGEPIDFTDTNGTIYQEGIIVATYEDILRALNEHRTIESNRWLLASDADNIESGVTIDKVTGEVTIDKSSGVLSPEFDSNIYEIQNGGAYNQAVQFAKLFTDTDAQIVGGFTDALIQKSIEYVLAGVDILTFSVFNYRASAQAIVIDVAKLAEEIYCSGSFANGLFQYASNPANHDATDFGYILDMASDVPNSTLSNWNADGKQSPSSLYTGYACYRAPSQSITFDVNNFTRGNSQWYTGGLANRRYRLEIDVTEVLIDANGTKYDGVYFEEAGQSPSDFYNVRLLAGGTQVLSSQHPAYLDGTGKYVLEFAHASTITGSNFQLTPMVTPVSGSITLTLYDLGAN